MKMNNFEIIINGLIHICLSVVMFIHIDRKCYPTTKTKLFFVIPLWSMFLGFYNIRGYLDNQNLSNYWRLFGYFETLTNILFLAFFAYKNQNLKKNEKRRRHI